MDVIVKEQIERVIKKSKGDVDPRSDSFKLKVESSIRDYIDEITNQDNFKDQKQREAHINGVTNDCMRLYGTNEINDYIDELLNK